MSDIKPLETRYASCRFRSRLEARWAVFFDHLGVHWEYEPEGYVVGIGPNARAYLPDFWLPDPGVWVEVKGAEEHLDVETLVAAALPAGGLPSVGGWQVAGHLVRMLILGTINQSYLSDLGSGAAEEWYCYPTHTVLTYGDDVLMDGTAWFQNGDLRVEPDGGVVADREGRINWKGRRSAWGGWVTGGTRICAELDERTALAYRAARCARFEHGEQG